MVVAIDGPAGAGKSTVARKLAERIGGSYLNTGSMYRAVALVALREGIDLGDGTALAAAAADHRVEFATVDGRDAVFVDGSDVTEAVRSPEVGASVSLVAAHGELRRVVVAQQRRIIAAGDWVADGRDIGTVVAPDAELKVFLTADPRVRAERRHAELHAAGASVSVDQVHDEIVSRDSLDMERSESPLTAAPGAHVVDTSNLAVDEVVDVLAGLVATTREGTA